MEHDTHLSAGMELSHRRSVRGEQQLSGGLNLYKNALLQGRLPPLDGCFVAGPRLRLPHGAINKPALINRTIVLVNGFHPCALVDGSPGKYDSTDD